MAKPVRLTRKMIEDNIALGHWDGTSITDLLEGHAASRPDEEAVVDSAQSHSWSQLNRVVNAMAAGLMDLGLRRDDALVAQLPSSADALIILLACQKAGILSCFSPLTFRHNELRHVLKTLNAAAVITPMTYRNTEYYKIVKGIAGDLPALRHFIITGEETPDNTVPFAYLKSTSSIQKASNAYFKRFAFSPFEVSMVVLSSGSTGMPKCIEQLGASCKVGGWGLVERGKLTREDIFGIIAPLSGGPGLQNWWGALQLGVKVCLLEHFSADETLQLIQKDRVTYLAAVPSQIIKILKEADVGRYDLRSLRIVRTGAAAFDEALAREAEERLKCTVLIAGGSQETYSFAQTGLDDPPEKRAITLGKPFPGNEVKICNEQGQQVAQGETGHLYVRGAATCSGYFGDREATLAAWGELGPGGWFKTGDLAKIDEDGYVILVGRHKDIIIRGGQNIYPKEIEDLLLTHPKILQAAVIGMPDSVLGERAWACLTIADGQDIVFEEMITYLKKKGLAIHKLPEALHVLDRLPALVEGQKINKVALKEMMVERMKQS